MVDGLCVQSGGKLMLRSRLYQGTTIELWLPATNTEAATRLPTTVGDSASAIAADRFGRHRWWFAACQSSRAPDPLCKVPEYVLARR